MAAYYCSVHMSFSVLQDLEVPDVLPNIVYYLHDDKILPSVLHINQQAEPSNDVEAQASITYRFYKIVHPPISAIRLIV